MISWKKFLRGVIQAILVVFILLNVVVISSQYEDESDLLETIPFGVLEVTGGSMEPYLSPGDGIFVYEVPFEDLQLQDTVLFTQGGELVTHRIMEIGEGYLITKGTANDIVDTPVSQSDYKAKVLFGIPYLSVILMFYESPIYFVIFAVLLFFFLFSSSLAAELYERVEQMRKLSPPEDGDTDKKEKGEGRD